MEHCTYLSNSPPALPSSDAQAGTAWMLYAQEILIRAFDAVLAWEDKSRERRRLGTLDDRLLRDIGLDRASADAEVAKPFWRS
jgi:uncharacterized protein YjiS (DUF1127 family)